jgi:hypothetical protein
MILHSAVYSFPVLCHSRLSIVYGVAKEQTYFTDRLFLNEMPAAHHDGDEIETI